MHKLSLVVLTVILSAQSLLAADETKELEDQVDGRWYTQTYVHIGKTVYEQNCMVCHGANGEGLTDDWKKPLADGSYPPPPLNGTAHTWHHPMSILIRTINKGGKDLGGQMPPFLLKLSNAEKIAVVAYIQNWWPDEIYAGWEQRGGLKR